MICFATRHRYLLPEEDALWQTHMPNLQQITNNRLRETQNHPVQTTRTEERIPSDRPLYYSMTPAELFADNAKT